MDLGVVVHSGVDGAHASSSLIHVRADGGEGDGGVVEGLVERDARVSDEEGDKLHPSPIFLDPALPQNFGLFAILMSLSKSLEKPTSTRMRVHVFLLNEVGSGEGESGPPSYTRGPVQCRDRRRIALGSL